jgi:hypothetical protein
VSVGSGPWFWLPVFSGVCDALAEVVDSVGGTLGVGVSASAAREHAVVNGTSVRTAISISSRGRLRNFKNPPLAWMPERRAATTGRNARVRRVQSTLVKARSFVCGKQGVTAELRTSNGSRRRLKTALKAPLAVHRSVAWLES